MLVSVAYGFLLHSSPIIFPPLHGWQASEAQKPQVKFMSSLCGLPKHSSISFLLVSYSTAKEEVKVWVRTLWILIHSFFFAYLEVLSYIIQFLLHSPPISSISFYEIVSICEDQILSLLEHRSKFSSCLCSHASWLCLFLSTCFI